MKLNHIQPKRHIAKYVCYTLLASKALFIYNKVHIFKHEG